MKQKPLKLFWIVLPLACWTLALFIQQGLEERPPQPPTLPDRSEASDTIFVDELELTLLDFATQTEDERPYVLPADALARSLSSRTRIRERDIKNKPKNSPDIKQDKGYYFIDANQQKFAASKLGLDFKHHFQNCFLVGYKPFDVSEIWMPHEVLTMRLKYQLDEDNFAGFQEVWLTSYEAFQRGRGDCEDHAIALADWLIEMGEDARVVTGTHKGGGHAWVVLIREKGTFLLESTDKKLRRLFSSYPLAKLAKDYVPETMFNREFYWINSKPEETSDYTGSHWFKNGRITY
ncbi:transglutaminase domain-containing protein [Pelagicoccus sp. SDUM812005]|uniref:transglutaminase domain-containing protein n=1 Tax=Pelagicoccus sp. SDUM812005 TaxID=3041257 RepID=UPI0028107007|nr:transglutaminase domain-containing protein [Pelagicoccus sp. SDUM812005]MDQ8181853.1 transglutaminase-like cysteine peptidase [Pelagicoccus sp. SDUM812005]